MNPSPIDLSFLRLALAQLDEALRFWHAQAEGAPLKRHLRAAVIQAFEFSYELAMRTLRRVLVERVVSQSAVVDLSFNDMLRKAADAGLLKETLLWRHWRELRNSTSHTYDEDKAQEVADQMPKFLKDAQHLLARLEQELES